MAQPPEVEKHGEFGVTAQFVIEVQPLFIRNSFQQFFCLRALVSTEILLFKPKWIWNKIPDVIRDSRPATEVALFKRWPYSNSTPSPPLSKPTRNLSLGNH
jgi:hypothetical protein